MTKLDLTRVVSAPGKLVVSGEYAVLENAPAVVAAVTRRVRARLADPPPKPLAKLVSAVREEMAESTAFAGIGRAAMDAIRRVVVDSGELCHTDGTKLGLGSSAATAVVAAASALSAENGEIRPQFIHRLAHRAHSNFQSKRGAAGSGADIASCTYGGVLEVRVPDLGAPVKIRPLTWPDGAHLVCAWTGQPADTATLVEKVRMLRIGNRQAYNLAINRVADASAAVIDALERGDTRGLISAIDHGAAAVDALGQDASAPLTIPAHRRLISLARECSGSAKPTGAAGGDVAVAVFASADDARAFADKAKKEKMVVLDEVGIDPAGVRIDG